MMRRLPPVAGEWINRARPIALRFEGRRIEAFDGDCLSSALAGAGVLTVARSFKYHRPRGLVSLAGHDANALFQVGSEPNQRGDSLRAVDGMAFTAVNTFGGLAADRGRIVGRLARFLPVGFYYKAFRGPRSFPLFERLIRYFSGLGRVDLAQRPQPRVRVHEFCEVAVIGAGTAGLSAALSAAHTGAARVVLVDENASPGGSGLWADAADPSQAAATDALRAAVAAEPRIRLMPSSCAIGLYADHQIAISRMDRVDGGLTLLRATAVVLATGAIEQPVVFRHNDLPGILLASAAQRLLHRYAIACGERIVVLGANRDAVDAALDLAAQGLGVSTLAMLAGNAVDATDLRADALERAGITLLREVTPVEALPDAQGTLRAVVLSVDGTDHRLDCDALLMSAGWMPALALALQAGATVRYDEAGRQHLPATLPDGLLVAGRANGIHQSDAKRADGERAGADAAAWVLRRAAPAPFERPAATPRSHAFPVYPHPLGKEFVDLDEDLTIADLRNAAQEGFDSIELLKRYSTVGMGPSQGKLSNLNAARILGSLTDAPLQHIGLTTARPPYQPVTLGALAGAGFSPLRRTALDARHVALGAVWMPAGHWRRPAYYARPGSAPGDSIAAEARAVREAVGLIDVSTLGKIDVAGPDAALLLERLYTGRFADMAPGTTRYALMVDEAGTVTDDGVVARLAADHFYVSTTTSGAAGVYREMQRRVAEWRLDCILHNLTGHLAAMNLAGAASRDVLRGLCDADLSPAAFPYLGARSGRIAGVMARIQRVGFVGELGYEIHVAYDAAGQVWDALLDAGRAAGIRPFGVEAQRLLRLEKAHVIVGQDTDGITNPFEAGMGWAVKQDKPFFVGQRSLQILKGRGTKQQLAGFALETPDAAVQECHLVIAAGEIAGRVTSIGRSFTLGRTIGLAMLDPALTRPGTSFIIRGDSGRSVAARVVATPFYDPGQVRQRSTELAP
jgi:sarcosine oxidase subunit alpha